MNETLIKNRLIDFSVFNGMSALCWVFNAENIIFKYMVCKQNNL